jgi:hypothetical protein
MIITTSFIKTWGVWIVSGCRWTLRKGARCSWNGGRDMKGENGKDYGNEGAEEGGRVHMKEDDLN